MESEKRELPYGLDTQSKIKNLLGLVCEKAELNLEKELYNLETQLINYPRYIPERIFAFIAMKLKYSEFDLEFYENKELEIIVCNNYIFGDLEKIKEITDSKERKFPKEDSFIYQLLNGEMVMRVNVIHPMFLSDQHLVAEYREVKMGPKALSKSLFSLKGIDKKRISPKYILNTGHTYFFYDKNGFLERRLEQLCTEMKKRGIQCNHEELIDDKYDYHKDTFNDEWWGDWKPDTDAVNVNMERINQRFSIKPDGWYRFWKRPVLDMQDIIHTRAQNSFWECPSCGAIHVAPEGVNWVCWKCCKKIPVDTPKISYF